MAPGPDDCSRKFETCAAPLGDWLSAAHCGPPLAGGEGGAMVASTSKDFREYDHTFLKHIRAVTCVVKESEIEN